MTNQQQEREARAIVACGEKWKLVADEIGCALHGFNDDRSASFITPDGAVIEVGPKFRHAIVMSSVRAERTAAAVPVSTQEWRLVPIDPSYEQLARMGNYWCCSVEEMAECWAEMLDELDAAAPQPEPEHVTSAGGGDDN